MEKIILTEVQKKAFNLGLKAYNEASEARDRIMGMPLSFYGEQISWEVFHNKINSLLKSKKINQADVLNINARLEWFHEVSAQIRAKK